MNLEKTVFAFFIVSALTLNFGFFYGPIDSAMHHNAYEFAAALVVNLIAMVLKFGDRTHVGATMLATSLVANLQILAAALVWGIATNVHGTGSEPGVIATVVSLTGGALVANIISVTLLVIETSSVRR
jgi:Ca2+/H+ antiporter, TMEM165/GDT1 family